MFFLSSCWGQKFYMEARLATNLLRLWSTGRRTLRSLGSNRLLVPPFKLSTVGGWAFPVADAHLWNTLPDNVTSVRLLSSFAPAVIPKHRMTMALLLSPLHSDDEGRTEYSLGQNLSFCELGHNSAWTKSNSTHMLSKLWYRMIPINYTFTIFNCTSNWWINSPSTS